MRIVTNTAFLHSTPADRAVLIAYMNTRLSATFANIRTDNVPLALKTDGELSQIATDAGFQIQGD